MAILDKINLDFHILNTGSTKTLSILDASVWGAIEDKVAILEITVPGSSKVRTYTVQKGKVVIFNSSNLYLSPLGERSDLADGVYKISMKGSPDSYCKHRDFLKTDNARLELANLYLSLGLDNADKSTIDLKKKIQDIELLIKSAEVLTARGKLKQAYSRFKIAISKINEYNECQDCS